MSLKPDAAITELGDQSGIACSGTAKVVEDVDPALACESDDHVQSLLPRSYQREMLEASLKRNIIVAMDTGSGKSLIAVLRIQAELELCVAADKRVFVLVPTVALAAQWNSVIISQLPSVQTRFLSGADGVDRWRDQWIWDEVLSNIRIVVCTYQILLDALIHGFIQMSRLALIVFDEAHHCVASHPANRIMRDFFNKSTTSIPAILGLTASPITQSKAVSLNIIEGNLNAIARTPKLAREELLRYVHQPELVSLVYPSIQETFSTSQALGSVQELYSNIDIEQDPFVIKLRSNTATATSPQLLKALYSRKTYCQEQLKSLLTKSQDIFHELGSWATDYYIRAISANFCAAQADNVSLHALDNSEKDYLKNLLRSITISIPSNPPLDYRSHLSQKVKCLINFLTGIETTGFTGLVFVKTRATCAVLSHLLSTHEQTKDALRVSTFVGASSNVKKFDIGELVDVKNQKDTLDHLRLGQKNLIIATSALEEGIDVSACNLVVCFEKPVNLRTFIQRRGRARKSQSKYVLMFPEEESQSALANWQQLEEEMRRLYMDEMRQLRELQDVEATDSGYRELKVDSTGAKITLEDAVQHLYHFCATIPADRYVDPKPMFTFTEDADRMISASVILPNSVDAAVREARSPSSWKSQKMAKRDAALEAYANLYHAGLLSDHLLPLRVYDAAVTDALKSVQTIASLVEVRGQLSIWPDIASEWQSSTKMYTSTVSISSNSELHLQMLLLLPRQLPNRIESTLYWNITTCFGVTVEPSPGAAPCSYSDACALTGLLLRSVFMGRMQNNQNDFASLFVPTTTQDIQGWTNQFQGTTNAEKWIDSSLLEHETGIVRDVQNNGTPHIFHGIEFLKPRNTNDQLDGTISSSDVTENDEAKAYLKVKKLPKRADFLHPVPPQNLESIGSGFRYLRPNECDVDNLPFGYAQFALFIPSIQHVIETNMLAEHLCNSVLSTVQFSDLPLVVTAISASASQGPSNYQRLEFLGDSILKYLTSCNLLVSHPNWHEGYLSHQKDHVVSNANLARSALAAGLDNYILSKPFTGQKWRPPYISTLSTAEPPQAREMSTKTLADVVESLIGAAYLDGGFSKALLCIQVLLTIHSWAPIPDLDSALYETYASKSHQPLPDHFIPLQSRLTHNFTLPSLLLESLTHPSHLSATSTSYQRLEFLGDVLLDRIITTRAFSHVPEIETHTLHLIRTALVNANFLAFLCMDFCATVTRSEIITSIDPNSSTPEISSIETQKFIPLWAFLRHSSPSISTAQSACQKRYELLREPILSALRTGTKYPWTLLARLDAPKFFSDIIESVLGAIYIDSRGSWEACERFLEALGVGKYLGRVLAGEVVGVKHPKEELGVVAGNEKVKYEVFGSGMEVDAEVDSGEEGGKEDQGAINDDNREEKAKGRLNCKVWVGEREIVCVGDGTGRVEVETRAAEEAIEILHRERAQL